MILWKERSSMHWQRFKSRSFYLLRYLFCQFLWPISHSPLQVCETSASDPFPLRSHHRMNLDESRFDWGTYGVSTSHQKKKYPPMNPVDGPYYFFWWISAWHMTLTARLVCDLPETCQIYWLILGKWVPFINTLFELASTAYGISWSTQIADHIISVYPFTYLSLVQGLLVFNFREACHPMVDTRPPIKTF